MSFHSSYPVLLNPGDSDRLRRREPSGFGTLRTPAVSQGASVDVLRPQRRPASVCNDRQIIELSTDFRVLWISTKGNYSAHAPGLDEIRWQPTRRIEISTCRRNKTGHLNSWPASHPSIVMNL